MLGTSFTSGTTKKQAEKEENSSPYRNVHIWSEFSVEYEKQLRNIVLGQDFTPCHPLLLLPPSIEVGVVDSFISPHDPADHVTIETSQMDSTQQQMARIFSVWKPDCKKFELIKMSCTKVDVETSILSNFQDHTHQASPEGALADGFQSVISSRKVRAVLKALTRQNTIHLRPLCTDMDVSLALQELFELKSFRIGYVSFPQSLKGSLTKDSSGIFRYVYHRNKHAEFYFAKCVLPPQQHHLQIFICPALCPQLFVLERVETSDVHQNLMDACKSITSHILSATIGDLMCERFSCDFEVLRPVGSDFDGAASRKAKMQSRSRKTEVQVPFAKKNKSAALYFRLLHFVTFEQTIRFAAQRRVGLMSLGNFQQAFLRMFHYQFRIALDKKLSQLQKQSLVAESEQSSTSDSTQANPTTAQGSTSVKNHPKSITTSLITRLKSEETAQSGNESLSTFITDIAKRMALEYIDSYDFDERNEEDELDDHGDKEDEEGQGHDNDEMEFDDSSGDEAADMLKHARAKKTIGDADDIANSLAIAVRKEFRRKTALFSIDNKKSFAAIATSVLNNALSQHKSLALLDERNLMPDQFGASQMESGLDLSQEERKLRAMRAIAAGIDAKNEFVFELPTIKAPAAAATTAVADQLQEEPTNDLIQNDAKIATIVSQDDSTEATSTSEIIPAKYSVKAKLHVESSKLGQNRLNEERLQSEKLKMLLRSDITELERTTVNSLNIRGQNGSVDEDEGEIEGEGEGDENGDIRREKYETTQKVVAVQLGVKTKSHKSRKQKFEMPSKPKLTYEDLLAMHVNKLASSPTTIQEAERELQLESHGDRNTEHLSSLASDWCRMMFRSLLKQDPFFRDSPEYLQQMLREDAELAEAAKEIDEKLCQFFPIEYSKGLDAIEVRPSVLDVVSNELRQLMDGIEADKVTKKKTKKNVESLTNQLNVESNVLLHKMIDSVNADVRELVRKRVLLFEIKMSQLRDSHKLLDKETQVSILPKTKTAAVFVAPDLDDNISEESPATLEPEIVPSDFANSFFQEVAAPSTHREISCNMTLEATSPIYAADLSTEEGNSKQAEAKMPVIEVDTLKGTNFVKAETATTKAKEVIRKLSKTLLKKHVVELSLKLNSLQQDVTERFNQVAYNSNVFKRLYTPRSPSNTFPHVGIEDILKSTQAHRYTSSQSSLGSTSNSSSRGGGGTIGTLWNTLRSDASDGQMIEGTIVKSEDDAALQSEQSVLTCPLQYLFVNESELQLLANKALATCEEDMQLLFDGSLQRELDDLEIPVTFNPSFAIEPIPVDESIWKDVSNLPDLSSCAQGGIYPYVSQFLEAELSQPSLAYPSFSYLGIRPNSGDDPSASPSDMSALNPLIEMYRNASNKMLEQMTHSGKHRQALAIICDGSANSSTAYASGATAVRSTSPSQRGTTKSGPKTTSSTVLEYGSRVGTASDSPNAFDIMPKAKIAPIGSWASDNTSALVGSQLKIQSRPLSESRAGSAVSGSSRATSKHQRRLQAGQTTSKQANAIDSHFADGSDFFGPSDIDLDTEPVNSESCNVPDFRTDDELTSRPSRLENVQLVVATTGDAIIAKVEETLEQVIITAELTEQSKQKVPEADASSSTLPNPTASDGFLPKEGNEMKLSPAFAQLPSQSALKCDHLNVESSHSIVLVETHSPPEEVREVTSLFSVGNEFYWQVNASATLELFSSDEPSTTNTQSLSNAVAEVLTQSDMSLSGSSIASLSRVLSFSTAQPTVSIVRTGRAISDSQHQLMEPNVAQTLSQLFSRAHKDSQANTTSTIPAEYNPNLSIQQYNASASSPSRPKATPMSSIIRSPTRHRRHVERTDRSVFPELQVEGSSAVVHPTDERLVTCRLYKDGYVRTKKGKRTYLIDGIKLPTPGKDKMKTLG